jgi:alpha-beta hydrolase superfamily lysophospholipase
MDRRFFMNKAALGVGAAGLTSLQSNAQVEHSSTKRFTEQHWAIDNIIKANGIDWDQPRSIYLQAPCGVESLADFAAIRSKVQKMADIGPAFESTAKRRETKAIEAQNEGHLITARDNWFMAAVHYGAAEWPYDDSGSVHLGLHQKKRECFANYARLSEHHVEAVSIAFKGSHIPAWFHLPPNYKGGRIPVVIAIPGMDSFKEATVSLSNDKWLSRGMAVLAIDGPGQYESPLLGLYVSMNNWIDAGPALVDWLLKREEIDPTRIGLTGNSFGSFFGTILAANEPRIAATVLSSTCLEPGCHTIFEEASPTFKKRFMWMSNFTDEQKFDKFTQTLSWEGHIDKIKTPYMVLAGEADELSPLHFTDLMFKKMKGPRQLVVYAESRHSVGNVPSANLGPNPGSLMADWLIARLNNKPFTSERWFVEPSGRITKSHFNL